MNAILRLYLSISYRIPTFMAVFVCTLLLTGCAKPENYVYINDIQPNLPIAIQEPIPLRLKTGDKLTIMVHSRDQELADIFNLNKYGENSSGFARQIIPYTVDINGNIDMPVIGSVQVKDLSRMEVQNAIRHKLLTSKLVRDPIVAVEFVDMAYYVVGDIGGGRHEINRDVVTLVEAISECGDLLVTGRRDNILVLRTTDGIQTPYEVNLLRTSDLYSSPVYYLQQGDVIYVRPTTMKIDQTSAYGSSVRTPVFWIGLLNMVLGLTFLFKK